MKLNIKILALSAVALTGVACTANYTDINSDPYGVDKKQMQTDGYAIGSALTSLAGTVVSTDVNTCQFTDCLLGGPMGGYFATTGAFGHTIDNYDPTDNWTNVFLASDKVIPVLYNNLAELKDVTDDPIALSIGQIIKVMTMNRVTDTYGPIPYTKVTVGGALQVAYDSQKDVYYKMFEELNDAIAKLSANRTGAISASADNIYGGKAEQWCKLANSVKLRLAMRIVYADPEMAKKMAEEAVNNEIGVMTANADNARLSAFGKDGNPIYVSVKYNTPTHSDGSVCMTGGDTHVAADITCYMNAYSDPRRAAYFVPSEWDGQSYSGIRRGITYPSLTLVGHKYSGVKLTVTSPVYWMNAAEVAFLRAEAVAVFGFNMGGTAEEFYKQGIRLSFEQWGVSGADAYMAQSSNVSVTYTDPAGSNTYNEVLTTLPVAWKEGASVEEKQERILIQKWIANWQLGNEAWADYRRTGFPHLIPATTDGNRSNGIVDSKLGARRMPYPQAEYTTNTTHVTAAVSNLLKGADNMATRLWWDCNPAIK